MPARAPGSIVAILAAVLAGGPLAGGCDPEWRGHLGTDDSWCDGITTEGSDVCWMYDRGGGSFAEAADYCTGQGAEVPTALDYADFLGGCIPDRNPILGTYCEPFDPANSDFGYEDWEGGEYWTSNTCGGLPVVVDVLDGEIIVAEFSNYGPCAVRCITRR